MGNTSEGAKRAAETRRKNGTWLKCAWTSERTRKGLETQKINGTFGRGGPKSKRPGISYVDKTLRQRYGITEFEYNEILLKQNGVCAICNSAETRKVNGVIRKLAVDHDHKTGKVRGLLCSRCNQTLGLFNDDIALLDNAKRYLIKDENDNSRI